MEGSNGGSPDLSEAGIMLPRDFVERIKAKLGNQDFELEFLRGQVASQEQTIAALGAKLEELSPVEEPA